MELEIDTNQDPFLPDDLIHVVLSQMDFTDIVRASCLNKQWGAVCSHEDYWCFLDLENHTDISVEQFDKISLRYPNATKLNIFGVSAMNLIASRAITSLKNLETLHLGGRRLDTSFFPALVHFAALKNLSVKDATLGAVIGHTVVAHNGLKTLEIVNCKAGIISVWCAQLEHLYLKQSSMVYIAVNCPQLRELDLGLRSCNVLSDEVIRSVAMSCPLLTYLDISYCTSVTEKTLREVSEKCTNLVALSISPPSTISFASIWFPTLKVLKLCNCSSASMAAISHCQSLEVLEICDGSRNVTSISLNLNDACSLNSLVLDRCEFLTEVKLISSSLSHLSLNTNCALISLELDCPRLSTLSLQSSSINQDVLADAILQCTMLTTLDVRDCPKIHPGSKTRLLALRPKLTRLLITSTTA